MSLFIKIKNNLEHYQIINLLSKAKDASENLNYTGDLTIDTNNYWLKNISKLANFLKFAGYNEDNVSYQNIKDFIDSRTNLLYGEDEDWLQILQDFENEEKTNKEKSDFQIFSPTKMEEQRNPRELDEVIYDAYKAGILSKPRTTRDLNKAIETIEFYKSHPIPRPMKPKKEPFGKEMDKIMPAVLSGR